MQGQAQTLLLYRFTSSYVEDGARIYIILMKHLPIPHLALMRAVGLEPTRTYVHRIFLLLYVTIADLIAVVVWSTSLPYLIQTQVAGVYSLHIYSLRLYFFLGKFLLKHDNLDINSED